MNTTDCIIQCNSDCGTCDTTGKCISCADGKYLINGTCQLCSYPCANCVDTNSKCLTCPNLVNRFNDETCHCYPGFYDTGINC